jgi:beta-galactosidase
MRKVVCINKDWKFVKENVGVQGLDKTQGLKVDIPHTWNAKDGQDGGNDYYRGTCWYIKEFERPEMNEDGEVWLEFRGVAMIAEVYMNGQKLARHEGGYSTFRVNITEVLQEKNQLVVSADNEKNDKVYPQKADFTFYGGIYRDIYLITVPSAHFDLSFAGGPGIKVTPKVKENAADISVETWIQGDAESVTYELCGEKQVAEVQNGYAKTIFRIEDVHLWDGLKDPYLYTVTASLNNGDKVEAKFGCRTFEFNPEKGFILNGRSYPLCGAARHQDREGVGYAITKEMMDEDMDIMLEMGANTIRLAHYQHDQYFYDLCDQKGMITWVEIPYITEHMPTARENTISQMTELLAQNYNHPSIVCWGLSNEITAAGGVNEDLIENHQILNDLCHKMDATRPTVMAHAFMLEPKEDLVKLPDICSYNLYYGWYLGELEANDQFFDQLHQNYPNAVVGLSEYGADANPAYQNSNPERGDWSETYQAVYHEHMLNMWAKRPYIWAMHCWNMFDFGADGREEGGKPGQNQKGLVTFDRKTYKDAFYIYKAYLSADPFVHLCGRRYIERCEENTEIKVYSNLNEVELSIDGKVFEVKKGDKVFKFQVPLNGEHTIVAKSGNFSDTIHIKKVNSPNSQYKVEGGEVVNWFDKPEELEREGYFSILNSMEEIKKNPQGAALIAKTMAKVRESYGDVARGVYIPDSVQKLMDQSPLQKILKQAGKAVSPSMVKELNHELNQIKIEN